MCINKRNLPLRILYVKWCMLLVTLTTRPCIPLADAVATSSDISSLTRRKCPRWFTAK